MLYRRFLISFLALIFCGYGSNQIPEQEKAVLNTTFLKPVNSDEQALLLKAQNAIQDYTQSAVTIPYKVHPADFELLQNYELKKNAIFNNFEYILNYLKNDPRGQLKTFTHNQLIDSDMLLDSEYPLKIQAHIEDVIENFLFGIILMNRPVDKFYEKELFFIDLFYIILSDLKGLISVRYEWLEDNVWLNQALRVQKRPDKEEASFSKQTYAQCVIRTAAQQKLARKKNKEALRNINKQIKVENSEKEIALLRSEKANLFLEIDDLKTVLKKRDEVDKAKDKKLKTLENQIKKLKVQLDKLKIEIQKPQMTQPVSNDDSKNLLKDLQFRLDQLTAENAELKKSKTIIPNADLENRARQLKSQMDKIKGENEQLKKANNDAHSVRNTHESLKLALEKKNAELIKSLQESAKREKQLQAKIQQIKVNFAKRNESTTSVSPKKSTLLPEKLKPSSAETWPVLLTVSQDNLLLQDQNSTYSEQTSSKPDTYARAVMQKVNRKILNPLGPDGSEMTKAKNLFSQEKTSCSLSQNDAEQRLQKLENKFDKIQGIVESLTTFRDFEGNKEKDRKVISIVKRENSN